MDYFHVYQVFSNLNQRFYNLVNKSNFPIKINLLSMSKSLLKRCNEDIIKPNIHRIMSFRLSNIFMYDYILLSIPELSKFQQLQTLILYNIESKYIENLLNQLRSLSLLSSLVISSMDEVKNKNIICRSIFSLPALKYCKISFLRWDSENPFSICTNECSSIEYLVITNFVYSNQLHNLLSYVPQLRHLSLHAFEQIRDGEEKNYPNLLS